MWKSARVCVYQLLNWKMHGETLKLKINKYFISNHKLRCCIAKTFWSHFLCTQFTRSTLWWLTNHELQKGTGRGLLELLYSSPGRTEENRVADGPTQDGARHLLNKSREISLHSDPFGLSICRTEKKEKLILFSTSINSSCLLFDTVLYLMFTPWSHRMSPESSHCHSGNTNCNFLGYVAVFCLSTLIMEVADPPETSVNIYKLLTYTSNAVGSSETSVLV